MTPERLAEIRRLNTRYGIGMKTTRANHVTELLAEVDRLQAGADSLLQDRNDAVRVLMALFPDRASDGTAHHMALVTRSEVDRLLEQVADAWDEGVRTALNFAIRNDDGVTLRLEHLDGRPWKNPHRSAAASGDEVANP